MQLKKSFTDYWKESARPLSSLVFVAPILALYELGLLIWGASAVRNAADVWLRTLLDWLGFGQHLLLPLLTVGILLGWHHLSRQPWRVRGNVFYGMLVESACWGVVLVVLAQCQRHLIANAIPCASLVEASGGFLRLLMGYMGAGFYEELLFRLMLLPSVIYLLRLGGFDKRWSLITGVVVTSLVFSAAHYSLDFTVAGVHFATGTGEAFQWFSFSFRFLAGVFFSGLFLLRGFGITVGAHAMYDVFTLLV